MGIRVLIWHFSVLTKSLVLRTVRIGSHGRKGCLYIARPLPIWKCCGPGNSIRTAIRTDQKMLSFPEIIPTVQPDPRLASCPVSGDLQFDINPKSFSLYLIRPPKNPPPVRVGDYLCVGKAR